MQILPAASRSSSLMYICPRTEKVTCDQKSFVLQSSSFGMGCSSSKELPISRHRTRRRGSFESDSDSSSISTSASESSSTSDRHIYIYNRRSAPRPLKSRSQNRRISCSLPTIDEQAVQQNTTPDSSRIGTTNRRPEIRCTNLAYVNQRHTSPGSRFSIQTNGRSMSRSNIF